MYGYAWWGGLKIYFIGAEIYIDNFNLLFFYVLYYIVTIIWGKVSILFYFLKQIGGNKQNVPGQCCPTDRMLANATEEQNVVFITLDLN